MEITTLEGLHVASPRALAGFAPDRDQQAAAGRGLSVGNGALHYAKLKDLRVAADVAAEANMNEFGLTPSQIYGAAMNLKGATSVTGFTCMTDDQGNTFFIVDTDAPVTKLAREKNLFGPRFYETSLKRYKGTGSGAANAINVIAGLNENVRGFDAGGRRPGTLNLEGTLITFTSAYDLFHEINRRRLRLDRPVVLVITNDVISWQTLGAQILVAILAIATPFASMIGIPPDVFDGVGQALTRLVTTGRIDIADLASVAQTIAPESVRKYLTQGADVYASIKSGDYVGAAESLGIDVRSARSVVDRFLAGARTDLLEASPLPLTEALAIVQNTVNVSLTDQLRAQARSGTLREAIIDAGSITRVPALQNYLIAATAPTLLGTLPNVQDILSTVINETNDAVTPDVHKTLLQAAAGYAIGPDALDTLALRALVERAIGEAATGARAFVMPTTVPEPKRIAWAAEVAKQSGIKVLAAPDAPKNITRYRPEWR